MRISLISLLAATALSSAAFNAQAASPFGAPSAPLTAEEKEGIAAEAAKIKRDRAAAAARAAKKRAAKAMTHEEAPVTMETAPMNDAEGALKNDALMSDEGTVTIPGTGAAVTVPTPSPATPVTNAVDAAKDAMKMAEPTIDAKVPSTPEAVKAVTPTITTPAAPAVTAPAVPVVPAAPAASSVIPPVPEATKQ